MTKIEKYLEIAIIDNYSQNTIFIEFEHTTIYFFYLLNSGRTLKDTQHITKHKKEIKNLKNKEKNRWCQES